MMRNGPPGGFKPPNKKKKIIQLQMLGHLKTQFKDQN